MYLLPFGEKTATLVCAKETKTGSYKPAQPCQKLTTEGAIMSEIKLQQKCNRVKSICINVCTGHSKNMLQTKKTKLLKSHEKHKTVRSSATRARTKQDQIEPKLQQTAKAAR